MVNPGGLEPPAAGLKVPCPADPGFTLGVRDPAFVRRHLFSPCLVPSSAKGSEGGWIREGARTHPAKRAGGSRRVHAGGTAPPVRRLSAAAVASPAHVRYVVR